ncbi:coagulation factor 5/8 type domain protein [Pedosphaera parvula Ellin514]|uniref:Coagulation factor 5/8 type domain protein n=2 Tax=Pedosphaera TaxID=1032526 RepID=B9XCZ3_PEDPL|nr:coagulation factor 5/8 type domain protein [Pedosphaera parvula Ellin514]
MELLVVIATIAFLLPIKARADTNSAATYLNCLLDFERYAETIWTDASYSNSPPNSGYWGDGASGGNGGIRGSSGVAVSYAVLVKAFPNDPKNATRISRITKALNYAANTHVSGTNVCKDGLKWGHDWQTAEWGSSMGFACVLVQSNLSTATVQACQRAVADEATYRSGVAPASGYISDTKAEENGWDSNILALGAAWMSTNANAGAWLTASKQYLANTYTVANTNGDPLASWVTTVTLYPDFALQNHGFYHPTYEMVAGMSMGDSLLMARQANSAIAAQLQPFAEHNVINVWNQLTNMVMDSGEFAYPAGLDWALHDYEQNSYVAWLAAHFNDPMARWADGKLAQLVRYRQQVNGDGRFVGESEPNGFYREAVEAKRTAIAYLHWANADFLDGSSVAPGSDVSFFSDVQVITHRSSFSFFSLSYGSRIMGMIEVPATPGPTNTFVASPKLPGMIGLGALGNPTAATLISFVTNANGFDAELRLQNGTQGTTEVYVKSTGETVAIVEVPYPAGGVAPGAVGSFTVGMENDPLCGGSRLVEWGSGSTNILNRSGTASNISNNWVCVSGRYGMAAGPDGYFSYKTATGYNRLGAAEDALQFVPQNTLGARYAVWFPGKTAVQTMSGATNISWSLTSSNAVLTFPGLGGAMEQITVAVPNIVPYPAYNAPVSNITASSSQSGYPPTRAIDGDANTFWVSSGTTQGQGPTAAHPEWLKFDFSRSVNISRVSITPRVNYGPKAVQVFIGTNLAFSTTMSNASLTVPLNPPMQGTNAQLLITSSYDPSYPGNSRNVQVVEVAFLERAQPGTFADWSIQHFTDAQLANAAIGGALGDADGDGVPNLLEFITGNDPWSPDASLAAIQPVGTGAGNYRFRFRERPSLGGITRQFQSSADLSSWGTATPVSVSVVANFGNVRVFEASFPVTNSMQYFRVNYTQ